MLTKPNKVIAISSFNGSIQWSFYSPKPVVKLFVESAAGSNFVHDVIIVTDASIIYLDPLTGTALSEEALPEGVTSETHDFMLIEGKLSAEVEGSHQVVLAVPKASTQDA